MEDNLLAKKGAVEVFHGMTLAHNCSGTCLVFTGAIFEVAANVHYGRIGPCVHLLVDKQI